MFNKTVIAAAVLAVTAGAAAAMDAPSQGEIMLANLAGVEPGVYTVADLVRLDDIRDESSSRSQQRFILQEGVHGVAGRASAGSSGISDTAGAAQNAFAAGVDAGVYSTSEIALIDAANTASNDRVFADFVKDGGLRDATGDSRSASPARQQLAGTLHVDAGDFTFAQLIRLNDAADENNRFLVNAILDEAGVDYDASVVLR